LWYTVVNEGLRKSQITEEREMEKKHFLVQYISSAFGDEREIPWQNADVSGPMTLPEARQEIADERALMIERCSSHSWDSHRRIVATVATEVDFTVRCWGRYETVGEIGEEYETHIACPTGETQTVTVLWLAGESEPQIDEEWTCPHCCARGR